MRLQHLEQGRETERLIDQALAIYLEKRRRVSLQHEAEATETPAKVARVELSDSDNESSISDAEFSDDEYA